MTNKQAKTGVLKSAYKFLKKTGILGYGTKKNVLGMNPLIVSTFCMMLTVTLAFILRKILNYALKDNIAKQLVMEFLATAEMCAVSFELIIIADNYGVWMYALYLFVLTVWWGIIWGDASACPYSPLEKVVEGDIYVSKALMIIVSQVLGGLVIFRYVQTLWSFEFAETHRGKDYLLTAEECSADLQVPMIVGAAIEGIAVCICRLTSKLLSDVGVAYAEILDAFFGTMMVVAAFNYSGGYFNPALATSLKYNCEGNTFIEHMTVYWVGASFGAICSVFIYRTKPFKSLVNRFTKVKSA